MYYVLSALINSCALVDSSTTYPRRWQWSSCPEIWREHVCSACNIFPQFWNAHV